MTGKKKRHTIRNTVLTVLSIVAAFGVTTALVMVGISSLSRNGKLRTGNMYASGDASVSDGTGTETAASSGPEGASPDAAETVSTASASAESAPGENPAAESAAGSAAESAVTESPAAGTEAAASPAEDAEAAASAESAETAASPAEAAETAASSAGSVSSAAEAASSEEELFSVPETAPGGGMPEIVTTTPDNSAELLASKTEDSFWEGCPEREVRLLTPNPYSRPQLMRTQVNTIVIHYVASPGTSAANNWEYFEGLKTGNGASTGTHFIIGLEGEIIQCIPLSEIAYATSRRNQDTLSIECCHPEADGKFNDKTYASLINLTAFLCKALHIKPEEVIRHYDVWGKNCPKYYVEHPKAWEQMKADIRARYDEIA